MIALTCERFCPICHRPTVHRRLLVPAGDINPVWLPIYRVVDGNAVLCLRCTEHEDGGPSDFLVD